eukprot:TRINITY_DN27976_c0_g1_i1.p1 TRINITY_DN27976_c0_g1~~TRINITY_DN27976_c0_g1_i1.p1  ORF type:complete len:1179 (+),score=303.08 TRINITY_DN27976_c0_g1_i1:115-3537(+)
MASPKTPVRHPAMERVELRRSLSMPAAARSRRLQTQAYLRCAEKGDVESLRKLALEMDAELSGVRVINRLGCDPYHLADSSHHLTLKEQQKVKYQFAELPQLIGAIGGAKEVRAKNPWSSGDSDDGMGTTQNWGSKGLGGSKTSRLTSKTSKSAASKENAAAIADKQLKGRTAQSHAALTRLTGTLKEADRMCDAAKTRPQLLWEPSHAGKAALPAFVKVLKSEELAVNCIHMNPELLRADAMKIQKVVPAVSACLGSPEEAAYAVATRPDILEVERPAGIRDSVKAVANCLCNMQEAIWLVVQTTTPPSIKVTARQFSREDFVGEYFRVEGGQVDDKVVYCKPASSMSFLGAKAKDMFLQYAAWGVNGEGCWTFTSKYEAGRRRGQMNFCDPNIMGWAVSERYSPDQVAPGEWHFKHVTDEGKPPRDWAKDPYVKVEDGQAVRGPWLPAFPKERLKDCFNMLREACGLVWREVDCSPFNGVRMIGSPSKGDEVHYNGYETSATFADLGSFSVTKGWNYLQLPATLDPDTEPFVLTSWEPVEIVLMYIGRRPKPAAAEVSPDDEEPGSRLGSKESKGVMPKYAEKLLAGGFRELTEAMEIVPKPVLKSSPQLQPEMYAKTFPRGRCEVPTPLGPGKLPPLIFMRSQVSCVTRNGTSCQSIKAKAIHEPIFFADTEPPPEEGDAEPLGEGEEPKETPCIRLESAGELGYDDFMFVKGTAEDIRCQVDETQVKIDTLERLQVAVAWFQMPPEIQEEEELGEDGEPLPPKEVPAPPLPDWVEQRGWKPLSTRLPLRLSTASGQEVKHIYLYGTEVKPGQTLEVPGSGDELTALVMWKQISERRPDYLRKLLCREPALLVARDNVSYFISTLRAELGDVMARKVLCEGAQKILPLGTGTSSSSSSGSSDGGEHERIIWPRLVQAGAAELRKEDKESMDLWVFEHKQEALAAHLGGNSNQRLSGARRVFAKIGGLQAEVTVPEVDERCVALKEVFTAFTSRIGMVLSEVLELQPALLLCTPEDLRRSAEIIERFLGVPKGQEIMKERPKLLSMPDELNKLFAKVQEKHPDEFICSRMQERTQGQWPLWPTLVGTTLDEIASWLGRITIEERTANCEVRVRLFGAEPHGAAALAALDGTLPPPPVV